MKIIKEREFVNFVLFCILKYVYQVVGIYKVFSDGGFLKNS